MKCSAKHNKGFFLSANTVDLMLRDPIRVGRVQTDDGVIATFDTRQTGRTVLSRMARSGHESGGYRVVPVRAVVEVVGNTTRSGKAAGSAGETVGREEKQ